MGLRNFWAQTHTVPVNDTSGGLPVPPDGWQPWRLAALGCFAYAFVLTALGRMSLTRHGCFSSQWRKKSPRLLRFHPLKGLLASILSDACTHVPLVGMLILSMDFANLDIDYCLEWKAL